MRQILIYGRGLNAEEYCRYDRAFAEWAKPNAQLQSLCEFM